MKKVLLLVLLATLFFTNCKKQSVAESTGPAYISFAPAFTLEVETKTDVIVDITDPIIAQVIGYSGLANKNAQFGDDDLYKYVDPHGVTHVLNRKITFKNGVEPTFDPKFLYPAIRDNNGLKNLKAYAPNDTDPVLAPDPDPLNNPDPAPVGVTVTRNGHLVVFGNLDGQTDVMVTKMQEEGGTFEAPAASGQGSAFPGEEKIQLTFERGLSKISFLLAALPLEQAVKANRIWGKITKIELRNHPNEVTLNLNINRFNITNSNVKNSNVIVHEARTHSEWEIPTEPGSNLDLDISSDYYEDVITSEGVMVPALPTITIRITSVNFKDGIELEFKTAIMRNTYHRFVLKLTEDLGVLMSADLIEWLPGAEVDLDI